MHRIRPARRPLTRLAVVAAVLAVLAAPTAWATDLFGDVPDASPHHDDINAIAGAGITGGCAPGIYCPAEPVRRDQMASFLRRGLGRADSAGTLATIALTGTFQDVAAEAISSGGAAGSVGFVVVHGEFTAREVSPGSLTAPNMIEFRLRDEAAGLNSAVSTVTLQPTPPGIARASIPVSKMHIFTIPTATTRTYRLQARRAIGVDAVWAETRQITLLYVPFHD